MHGFEMFQTLMSQNDDRVIKVRQGSLNHAVYRLAEEALIRPTAAGRNGNRPEHTTFEITNDLTELRTLKQVSTAPASHQVALDYLLVSTQAQVTWLRGFVESLRTGHLRWRQAAELDTIEGSRNEVGI